MSDKKFPIMVVDDFYDDPDAVREFALSLPYNNTENNHVYPGKRTSSLHEVSRNFFDYSSSKILSLFFDFYNDIHWKIATQFQLIHPYDDEKDNIKNKGWIHRDSDAVLAGVIYLTPNADPNSGTRFYKLKDNISSEYANSAEIHEERFKLYGPNGNIDDEYVKKFTEHRTHFEETVNVKNYYNRLVIFDSSIYHGVENIHSKEPRLTQVFFVNELTTEAETPIERMNHYLFTK